MFSTLQNPIFNFWVTSILLPANALNLDQSKILSFGKELKQKAIVGKGKVIQVYPFVGRFFTNQQTFSEKDKNAAYQPFLLFHNVFKSILFNPFPHNDAFWRPWESSLLKTLWEKEKLLVTSNFSFSHCVF